MRQAILVAMLVGAAFLGGAFVNGPGLQWAQSRVMRSLGLTNGGEIAAVDLKSTTSGETPQDPSGPSKSEPAPPPGFSATTPSVAAESKSSERDTIERPSAPKQRTRSSADRFGSEQSRPSSLPSATPTRSVTKSSQPGPAPRDPQFTPAGAEPSPRSSRSAAQADTHSAPALMDSLGALLAADDSSLNSRSPQATRVSPGKKPPADGGDEWALLVNRMQTLGVSRFTVEGEPGGHVVFACLIPLAGRQAITQRFEAEGEDVIQAAHAALRRVVLWRAAQLPQEDGVHTAEKNGR